MQLRVSFFIAILFCAVVAGGLHGRSLTRASCLLAGAFFTMLYLDARSLNQVEAELTRMVSTLPPGQRLVSALWDTASLQINGLLHVGSGACIGHCLDYGNYEPATGQFRIQVNGPNKVVAGDMGIVAELEQGRHIVTVQEAPLYSVCPSKTADHFELRKLGAGETTCEVRIPVTGRF